MAGRVKEYITLIELREELTDAGLHDFDQNVRSVRRKAAKIYKQATDYERRAMDEFDRYVNVGECWG